MLRIDADERWTKEGFSELSKMLNDDSINGIYVNRKTYFMGKWIRHGGFYPIRLMLVWRNGKVRMENRLMDEHMIVDGKSITTNIDVIEANYDRQQNLGLWTHKHNLYSDRYAAETILQEFNLLKIDSIQGSIGNSTVRKNWLRLNLYDGAPLFARVFLYYIYRYVFQLGFLDGKEGFIYHFLQAFWFRFLIDAKILQLRKNIKSADTVLVYLKDHMNIDYRDGRVYFTK